MLKLNQKKLSYTFDRCQQCGMCYAVCPENAISLSLRHDGLHDIKINAALCIACGKCVRSCPANKEYGYEGYFDGFAQKKYYLGYHADNRIRRESSSGGVCKTLIIDSLKNGMVDGAYSLKCTDSFPFAQGEFYTREHIPSFGDMPNSVYHSVMACTEIDRIQPCKRLMLVGTACQLRALNSIIKDKCDEVVRVCIFCKQQKTLDSTRFLAKMMGTSVPPNLKFRPRYRGDGWPGIVRVDGFELPYSRAAQIPFGKRLWTVPGCGICGDSFGMEAGADITLMDPWTICSHNELGETLVTVHTQKGDELLQQCVSLNLEPRSFSEVEPALSLKDVWRKQVTEPAYRGRPCKKRYVRAVRAERRQQRLLRMVVEMLPRLPIICYRTLAKLPDLRNRILNNPSFFLTMQIKVITRHTPNNYGSLLQSIATLRVIESLGHQCEIIDYWKRDEVGLQGILTSLQGKSLWKNSLFKRMAYVALRYPGEKIAALRFDKMRRRYLKLTPRCYSMEELESLQADVFMTGSDQVWGPLLDGGYDEAYFLSFVKEGIRKVSYAGSFGRTEFSDIIIASYKRLLSKYDALTVRESSAVKLLEEWGIDCGGQVLDPTLLLDSSQWSEYIEEDVKKSMY